MAKIDKIQIGETVYNLGVKAENIDGEVQVDLENYYNKQETDGLLENKQNKLTAGENITIDENNVISASGGSSGKPDYIETEDMLLFFSKNITLKEKLPKQIGQSIQLYRLENQGKDFIEELDKFLDIALEKNKKFRVYYETDLNVPTLYGYTFMEATDLPTTAMFYEGIVTTISGARGFNAFYQKGQYSVTLTTEIINSIGTGNETPFTPYDDYHPATKKYVDDMVGSIEQELSEV